MKLRHRLTLTFSLATALVLGVSFGAAVILVRRDRLRDLDLELLNQAPLVGDSLFVRKERKPRRPRPITTFAVLYSSDGTVVQVSDGFTDVPAWVSLGIDSADDEHFVDLRNEDTPLRGLVIERPEGEHFLFAISRRPIDDDLSLLYKVVGVLFMVGSAVAGVVAQALGRRLARDVEQVAQTARAVAAGDLTARMPEGADFSDEMRALKGDIDHMIGQLDEAMSAQRTFISHAAHELRSPLATIRGELQLALRKPRDVAAYQQAVATVLTDVEALIRLSEDLLTLARVGDTALDQRTTLGELIGEALRQARTAPDEELAIDVAHDRDTVIVRGARQDLSRALRNLIDNAVGHSPRGATIHIRAEDRADQIAVIVADEGPGVPDADQAQIFAPFFRGANEQSAFGAGLGLAIARQIARRYDGDVELLPTEPGATGARFALSLRRA